MRPYRLTGPPPSKMVPLVFMIEIDGQASETSTKLCLSKIDPVLFVLQLLKVWYPGKFSKSLGLLGLYKGKVQTLSSYKTKSTGSILVKQSFVDVSKGSPSISIIKSRGPIFEGGGSKMVPLFFMIEIDGQASETSTKLCLSKIDPVLLILQLL